MNPEYDPLPPAGQDAVRWLVSRFTFSEPDMAALQQDLALHIERAMAEFKATEMQALITKTLRIALQRRIEAAIDGWYQAQFPPRALKEDAA